MPHLNDGSKVWRRRLKTSADLCTVASTTRQTVWRKRLRSMVHFCWGKSFSRASQLRAYTAKTQRCASFDKWPLPLFPMICNDLPLNPERSSMIARSIGGLAMETWDGWGLIRRTLLRSSYVSLAAPLSFGRESGFVLKRVPRGRECLGHPATTSQQSRLV